MSKYSENATKTPTGTHTAEHPNGQPTGSAFESWMSEHSEDATKKPTGTHSHTFHQCQGTHTMTARDDEHPTGIPTGSGSPFESWASTYPGSHPNGSGSCPT